MGKQLLFFLCFCFLIYPLFAQNKTGAVQTTADIVSTTSTDETLFVKDLLNGGFFVHSEATLPTDNGVVFRRRSGGIWVRYFDRSNGVNPCWWGAVGDGIHNDLPALNAATKYCQENKSILQFPSGVFRITGPWVIGAKTIAEKDLFAGRFTSTRSFSMSQHQLARKLNPMIVRGSVNTCIYGDFKPSELTAIVYYNISGIGPPNQPSSHFYTHEFSNIGIYAQGSFKGTSPTPPSSVNMTNQQIGLVMLYCNMAKINHCNFSGLKYGLVCNTTYFTNISNCDFELCQLGLFTKNFNANLIENIVGFSCKLVAEINGAQLVVNNLNSESCESTLAVSGVNIVINGVYCENLNINNNNTYQIILGREADQISDKSSSITTNIIINGLTLTAKGRDVMLLNDDMEQLNINGANINGAIVSKSVKNSVVAKNLRGAYKFLGPGKLKQE